jgi:hypothetical protein
MPQKRNCDSKNKLSPSDWVSTLQAVKTPLIFFAFFMLVLYTTLAYVFTGSDLTGAQVFELVKYVLWVSVLALLIVAGLTYAVPQNLVTQAKIVKRLAGETFQEYMEPSLKRAEQSIETTVSRKLDDEVARIESKIVSEADRQQKELKSTLSESVNNRQEPMIGSAGDRSIRNQAASIADQISKAVERILDDRGLKDLEETIKRSVEAATAQAVDRSIMPKITESVLSDDFAERIAQRTAELLHEQDAKSDRAKKTRSDSSKSGGGNK